MVKGVMDRKEQVNLQTWHNQYIALAETANKVKLVVSIVLVFLGDGLARRFISGLPISRLSFFWTWQRLSGRGF